MSLYELIDLAKQAKEMGLVEWGFLHRPSPGGYFHMITAMFGGEFVDEKTGKLIIDTDALLKNFKFHRYLVENGLLPKDMTKNQPLETLLLYGESKVVKYFDVYVNIVQDD